MTMPTRMELRISPITNEQGKPASGLELFLDGEEVSTDALTIDQRCFVSSIFHGVERLIYRRFREADEAEARSRETKG